MWCMSPGSNYPWMSVCSVNKAVVDPFTSSPLGYDLGSVSGNLNHQWGKCKRDPGSASRATSPNTYTSHHEYGSIINWSHQNYEITHMVWLCGGALLVTLSVIYLEFNAHLTSMVTKHVEIISSPTLILTKTQWLEPKISNLDSSDQRTDFHRSNVHCSCFFTQASLFLSLVSFSSGLIAAIRPWRPDSRSLLWTVDVEMCLLLKLFSTCLPG
jgi:hypothetical protein